ncbi:MAG: ribbon-helix-helix protein, CopG family [Candidatus Thermoplasmatota archaeon]|nr:ribbon-helix-helix protein, CopG family [Euryarchaeota archaeon]MBU4031843.1 ribbon-helix-helix protein, CopG family [Candidatus Thermoplasmatota archaeon]MBU4071253.1 ribbon-helix-helix protein, CopG family [Candidatus Thermoplasmatota archaeon]MBU4144828.1 ribbon-helix-helix protein, CopG family [Candidatus Thermoplasmatota archaeon]MBU4591957.1 ribbon-helix-helix protein, CopG family [Candidatus Thermoplasmatota archaeon]
MQEQVDERVSARFEKAMMEKVDKEVRKRGYPNRSEFLRRATEAYLEAIENENTLTVELSPLLKGFIKEMVDRGYYTTPKKAIEDAITHYFTSARFKEVRNAATHMEVVTGKKVEADLDNSASRQIVKP